MSIKRYNCPAACTVGAIAVVLLTISMTLPVKASEQKTYMPEIPLGLDKNALYIPDDNPLTPEKIELGRLLYFDKRLSGDNTVACATCHKPELAFTDDQPVSMGVGHQLGGRSAPTVINRAFSKAQFWDGRAASLEEQAKGPLVNPVEMAMPSHKAEVDKLNRIEGYKKLFRKVYGTDVTIDGVAKAIASFERTVLSGNSPFDRYMAGDKKAMSSAAVRGLGLFRGKARCAVCHSGFNFTDEKYHNLGIDWDKATVDLGRFTVTKDPKDIGAFKTPTLRDIARTAPYMHDGRDGTLADTIEFYNRGGINNPYKDPLMTSLNLTIQEKKDLIEFLYSLNGEGWQRITSPQEFPM